MRISDWSSDVCSSDLFVQVMPEAEAAKTPYNPFDLTKVWPHGDYPLIEVGVMELNRNPDNYFAEIEQAAFSPSNVVPGIGHRSEERRVGKDVSVRVNSGGRRTIKKKKSKKQER